MRRSGLGKGLTALIPPAPAPLEGTPLGIPVEAIEPNPYQPRRQWPEAALAELCESIRQHGVLQPVLVRPSGGGYQLVAGERRWQACRQLGLDEIPAVVRELSDEEVLLLALVENLQREDLNSIEAAQAYQRALDEFGLTQAELAAHLGKSRAAIANTLRLLALEEPIQQSIREGGISEGHGRALLALAPGPGRLAAWRRALAEGLTVRELEALGRAGEGGRPVDAGRRPRSTSAGTDPHLQALAERLQRAIGSQASVSPRGEGGVVTIRYYEAADLERLVALVEAGAGRRRAGRP